MSKLDQDALSVALDGLYEAAAVPELWPLALEKLSRAAGGCGAVAAYAAPDAGSWTSSSPGMSESVNAYVAENWHARNPRVSRGMQAHAAGHAIVWDELIFKPGDLDREQIQRDFFGRFDLRHFFGMQLVPGHVILSVERGRHPLETWELEALRASLSHFQRIGRLALARGFSIENGLLAALDAMKSSALLVDHNGHVLHITDRAARLLPSVLRIRQGELRPRHAAAGSEFSRMILQATSSQAASDPTFIGVVALRREIGRPILAQALPLRGAVNDLFNRAKAVVLLLDPDEKLAANTEWLRRAFSLTASEARVASALARGDTTEDVACELGVSQETVRSHLRSIFAKTGTHRQGELIAVLSNLRR